jgi:transposase
MSWPALSPDLNPIENIWGYLAHKVYEGGRVYALVGFEQLQRIAPPV